MYRVDRQKWLQSGKTIAFVEQEIANSDQPALEFVLDGDVELRELEKNLAREQHDPAWFEAQQRYEAINGYVAKARAAQLLNGLGFANDTLERPVSSFSLGGSDRGFGGCVIFGGGISKPPNRQGAALFNQCIDLLNHWIASKTVSGVRLELACCRWQ
ncbi:MAG: hypothetical protein DID91_2727702338 [Candidatus Nitrotoga sp. MKT]|nr:MAG: hypothetical protein DID91_2727702338 [Candidatus Nitrotoga sp. MKT]